ncbi:hypothetical protein QBC34DRAFT_337928 [Podospora aff. communis PSN243]|uniref:Uncharacterized protein n=1 Tax=Podospora aff. communis PSN243 TaxID=3040156 RepID=A0AAV9G5R9_9PEZI|nr:hypothetical protein QBC34DRAFT_337928 [Podospora aff. communis PSN243]
MTLRDANGSPTATITPALPLRTAVVTTLTDSNGVPTATITHRPSGTPFSPFSPPPDGNAAFHIATPQEYWAVSFLPVFFAVLASIMVDSVSASLYALMPLKELTRPAGVGAKTLLSTSGTFPFVHGVDLLYRHGEPIRLLADLLVLFTAVITALSSEAVGIKLGGSCREDDARGCYMGVAIFSIPARVVEGFLCANIVLVLCLFLLLRRWESGATMAPGSVVSIGALMQDRELRKVLRDIHVDDGTGRVSDREVIRRLDRHRYFLGYNFAWGSKDYGIVAQRIKTRVLTPERSGTWVARAATTISTAGGRLRTRTPNWVSIDDITKGRVIFYAGLLYISGLLILVTYYENTILPDTAFEQFMNNQDFGVRVLFTAFGILLTFFWDYYYSWVSLREPYRRLWHSAPSHVLTTPRPTSPFTGFFGSLARREWFVSLVAFTNILSKFLPILLSTIPFSPFQTWEMHEGCTWTTIGTLGFMVLVLLWGHFAVRYPHFPVDPEGLVGQMYYLCDSEVVDNLRSAGWDSKEDILKRFGHRKYRFGEMVGSSGRVRMGVDYVRGKGEKGPEKGGAA